jgi:predicted TIM-barrel fold metal-dependent hydrolase
VRQEAPIIANRHGLSKVGDMIVDFHTHIFPPDVIERRQDYADRDPAFAHIYGNPSARMVDAEGLVEAMGEEGVDKAVVFGFPWADAGISRIANDYLLDAKARYADRIVPFYTPSLAGGKETVRRAARALEKGMQGIGEVAFYTSGMGKRQWSHLKSLAEVARESGAPLLLHANESVGHNYPGKTDMRLRDLWRFVEQAEGVTLVLAHWGGGLFFYELMKSVAKRVQSLYYDTAASPFLYSPKVYRIAADILGPERILFGSDFPLIRPSRYRREMEEGGLSVDAQRMILGQNACRLLQL